MLSYIVRRLILAAIVLIVLSFLTFCLIQLMPGDPASGMAGLGATPEQVNELRHDLWLDRPFVVQYGHWVSNALHGEFGNSLMYREPISNLFATRLPITLYLSILALIISTFVGITLGIFCGIRRNSILDQIVSLLANIGIGIPVFWLALLGVYLFGLRLEWLPIQGFTSPLDDFVKSCRQAILPVTMLAVPGIAVVTRQTRSSMLEVISQDYIRTAWSKGLKEHSIIVSHALKNALIPVVALLGIQLRVLVGGSVLVETIFNIPGMGRLLVSASFNKDFLVLQAGVLLVGSVVCLANLLVDLTYGWLDPRIRYE